jgi:hypothetical protein
MTERKRKTDEPKPVPIAVLPGLVDLVEHDGHVAFLIKKSDDLTILKQVVIDGIPHVPPEKTQIPFLLPRASEVLKFHDEFKKGKTEHQLFEEIKEYFGRFTYLTENQLLIVCLNVFLTYLQDHPDIHYLPMLFFFAVPERGKTRTGQAAIYISYRGVHCVDLREANLFRYAGNLNATLFLDIMNLWQKVERNQSEDVLLLRYERGAKVARVLYPEKGAFKDTVFYNVYGSTFMASNEPVHKILDSRCIPIMMSNKPGYYENISPQCGLGIKEKLTTWRAYAMGSRLPDVGVISGVDGRLWDITKPLFQVCLMVCPERYEDLIATIREVAGHRKDDLRESAEGKIVGILWEIAPTDIDDIEISTDTITGKYNEEIPEQYRRSNKWMGRRLKALGIRTSTATGHSIIKTDRKQVTVLAEQYGVIDVPVYGNNSKNSANSKHIETIDENSPEFLPEFPELQRNSKRNSKTYIVDNIEDLDLPEFSEFLQDAGEDIIIDIQNGHKSPQEVKA